ncbi:MAG: ABC transporter permease [Saprospiraceae bacterium]
MFYNYLKITFAVLKRRKLLTFISLFGVSFTLTILIVTVSFYDHVFSAKYPDLKRNQMLYISRVVSKDSKSGGTNTSPSGYYLIKEYVSKMKTPEKIGFATQPSTINIYNPGGNKLRVFYKYTDANFWDLHEFDFKQGKPYGQQNLDNHENVIVINEKTRDDYFGKNVDAIGKTFEIINEPYKVIGVVRGSPITRFYSSSDIYIPYNLTKENLSLNHRLHGSYTIFLKGNSKQDLINIRKEFADIVPKLPFTEYDHWFKPDKHYIFADNYVEAFSRELFGDTDTPGLIKFYLLLAFSAFIFMLLPAINLINININRIMERASEIGIRKAFGASANTLVKQFLVENIFVSLLGTLIAIALSIISIYYINHTNLIAYSDLTINWKVLTLAIIFSFAFGLISGVYPAWRMSKMNIVEALKY